MELAFIHRHLWTVLVLQYKLAGESLSQMEGVGGFLMEKTELMVKAMERAKVERDVMKEVVEKGVYRTVRHQLSDGHEDKLKTFSDIW